MGQNQVVGQHQATLKKFLLLERTKFLNPFRKQPPTNPLQSKSTRAISYAYGMIVNFIIVSSPAARCDIGVSTKDAAITLNRIFSFA